MNFNNNSMDGSESGYVKPKKDCPHISKFLQLPFKIQGKETISKVDVNLKCSNSQCDKNNEENWQCLTCYEVNCSRWKNAHQVIHYMETGHCIALSFSDFSIWCYACDSYIESPALKLPIQLADSSKFGGKLESKEVKEDMKLQVSDRLDASHAACHGWGGDKSWNKPKMVTRCESDARPGYQTMKAHEYLDDDDVLLAKVKKVAELIRKSKNCVTYTGAGISTSAGISDYATKSHQSKARRNKLGNFYFAQPTKAHRVLTTMYEEGYLKHWIQQNHDGLPQKAGYPQHELNEIHGGWFDPSNAVVSMEGNLRDDLFEWLQHWDRINDLCLTLGTSLCGMNADSVVVSASQRAIKEAKFAMKNKNFVRSQFGSVIVALQQTQFDKLATIRIYAKIDDVMELLAKELNISHKVRPMNTNLDEILKDKIPNKFIIEGAEDTFQIPFDKNGRLTKNKLRVLSLRKHDRVKITGGRHKGDEGVVLGKNEEGHYRIYFKHRKEGREGVRIFGKWWIVSASQYYGNMADGLFPIVNV